MVYVNEVNDLYNNLSLELRRGTIVLAILSVLDTPMYGYSLLQTLDKGGVAVDAGTLYPLLRRLEKQGVLKSEWNLEDSRPRKYYQISEMGKTLYTRLSEEWLNTSKHLEAMIKKETNI